MVENDVVRMKVVGAGDVRVLQSRSAARVCVDALYQARDT
jgi:hypothetical protein